MATKVHMEALSPTMEEGQLVRWLKHEGDEISEGDVLAEIETDKATMELVARGSGVLQNVSLKEGDTAPVGQVIAVIGAEGEAGGAGADGGAAGAAETEAEEAPERGDADARGGEKSGRPERQESATPAAEETGSKGAARRAESKEVGGEAAREEQAAAARGESGADGERVKASPLARRLAADAGVELQQVEGTGPGGRITKRDIEAAMKGGAARTAAPTGGTSGDTSADAKAPTVARAEEGPEAEEVPVSQMRKAIAKRLVQSIGPVPTFYLTIEPDMTRLMDLRGQVNRRLEKDGIKASINDFVIKAVAVALSRHPEVNASWGDNAIIRHRRVHVGVAVAVEDGLITPIVRDADRKLVREIAVEVKELAGRAREKKLKPEEYTGATFSISNLGMFGIVEFTAIINPPEAGILAVGAVEEKPVVVDGAVVVQPRMRITMSCDHRVIDGATGAKFLQTVRELIEEPLMMIV
jgi:pyruvate dehydrogenase E2 component (dihydrolipoamide acetyltransferase)